MKPKISRGHGFYGVVHYISDYQAKEEGNKNAQYVCGTTVSHSSNGIARELAHTRTIRPDITRPVWHVSLSMPAGEEPLSLSDWQIIVERFMTKMEFPKDTIYAVFRHSDKEHDHVHIVASRISLSGKVYQGKWEALKAINVCQEMERELGLTVTKGLRRDEKRLPNGELRKIIREGKLTPKVTLKSMIDEVLSWEPSLDEFVTILEKNGVVIMVNQSQTTGRISGLSYSYEGMAYKGSSLGKKYSWNSISKKINKKEFKNYGKMFRETRKEENYRVR